MNTKTRLFIAIPNNGSCEEYWSSGIQPLATELQLELVRIRKMASGFKVMSLIQNELEACDAVIAFLFEPNPNIYFEVGYAMANRKPCLIVTGDTWTPKLFEQNAKIIRIAIANKSIRKIFRIAILELMDLL